MDTSPSSSPSPSMNSYTGRPLSECERLFLSHGLCGNPQLVTYIAAYPAFANLPTKDTLTSQASGGSESMKGTPSGLSSSSEFPPSMEATLNCRPSLGFLVHQVWYELIVPSLPRATQRVLEKKPCWPAVPPRQAEDVEERDRQRVDHVHLSLDRLKRLKDHGKHNGVPTLHPIFEIAAAVAFWIVVNENPNESDDIRHHELHLVHSAPISFRQTSLGHPPVSGVYVGQLESGTTADNKVLFWPAVKEYASRLHSPKGQRRGLEVMGSLRFIPDKQLDVDDGSEMATGWEAFFLDRSRRAPAESFGVSNLGFSKRPYGTIGMAWCQSATLFFPPTYINLVGHDGGLDITLSRLAGCWADENGYDPLEHLADMYQRVLEALSDLMEDATGEGAASLTFGSIRALLQGD
ncbi:hypothetical protein QFC20_005384 [Naganishia adeliensis]|uniref:Uncharacterized protein n=1 Tax=Naganishia adeliensis TaxID=92952 RepID=A0ACC2VPY3_9TREE|nr:hypothetical protein QFC20_005384 [Naganishia adeliensis]